jgi:hypothetical protein
MAVCHGTHMLIHLFSNTCFVEQTTNSRVAQYVSIGITTAVTILAMRYIDAQRAKIIPELVYARRKRRQAKLQAEADLAASRSGSGPAEPYYSTQSQTAVPQARRLNDQESERSTDLLLRRRSLGATLA